MSADVRFEMLLCGAGINFDQGDLALSGVYLIQAPDAAGVRRTMVVDSGHVGMRRNLIQALVRAGVSATEVDYIAFTHLHWDHVQNIDLFPDAEVVVTRAEFDSVQGSSPRDLVTPAWTRHLLEDARLRIVEPGERLLTGVELVDAAGHTAGSLAFAVQVDGGTSVITGDALPWAEVARQQTSALVFWDLQRSQDTIARLVALADVIYPGHDRPFRLVQGEIEYLQPFEATMFGASPGTEGLTFGAPAILTTIDLTDGEPVGPRWTKQELEH